MQAAWGIHPTPSSLYAGPVPPCVSSSPQCLFITSLSADGLVLSPGLSTLALMMLRCCCCREFICSPVLMSSALLFSQQPLCANYLLEGSGHGAGAAPGWAHAGRLAA